MCVLPRWRINVNVNVNVGSQEMDLTKRELMEGLEESQLNSSDPEQLKRLGGKGCRRPHG